MFHDCAAHKPECPVHEHPELPTGCTCPGYSHPLCIFNYCPDPEFCRIAGVGCVNHSKDAANKRLEEQGGVECLVPPVPPEIPITQEMLDAAVDAYNDCASYNTDHVNMRAALEAALAKRSA